MGSDWFFGLQHGKLLSKFAELFHREAVKLLWFIGAAVDLPYHLRNRHDE